MEILIYTTIFVPIIAAIICYIIGRFSKPARNRFAILTTGFTFGIFLYLFLQSTAGNIGTVYAEIPYVCGMGLSFTLDGFRIMYGTIAAFMWLMCTLFSEEYLAHYHNRNRYYLFLLLTLGATEGVFLSADFFTTFVFFEMMSFTSYVWVAHDEQKESLRAAATYLAVAVIGGLVMLMGIFLLYDLCGTLRFDELSFIYAQQNAPAAQHKLMAAGICLLFGFGAKAGAFPLHIWLPKAHPVAPAPASALLSGILTKAGMYGILILTSQIFFGVNAWGSLILILGVCTMVVGAVLALFSVDLKRTLACSSVSQIGFVLVGVGISGLLADEALMAVRGSMLHMINHSLIKLTLFMAAGVVFMNVHKLNLNDIRGFGRKKPLLNYIFLMGTLGISGVPLFNGYVSKTLIHESIAEYTEAVQSGQILSVFTPSLLKGIEWSFLISGGLTAAYMAKLYVSIFIEKNADDKIQEKYDSLKGTYMNKTSAFALAFSATLLPIMGFFPHFTLDRLGYMGQSFMGMGSTELNVTYFSFANLKGALISLLIGAAVYFVVVRFLLMKNTSPKEHVGLFSSKRLYVDRLPPALDLENSLYRPVLLDILPAFFCFLCRILDSLADTVVVILRKTIYKDSKLPHELPEGTPLTHACARIAGVFQAIGNKTFCRKHPKNVDYDHKFALLYDEFSENTTMIARSMSFGLLLFCVGLILTVGYLFVKDIF